jgi:membrane fusion protein (multidrug efflux system)
MLNFKSKKNRLILLTCLVLLIILTAYSLRKKYSSRPMGPQDTLGVSVVAASSGSIQLQVQAIGTLVAANHTQVTAEFPGHVVKILANDGQMVQQGAPIIQLDDTEAKSKLAAAEADLIYAKTDYARKIKLVPKGIISKHDGDQALADWKGKSAVADQDRDIVAKMHLVAPFSGMLGKINVSLGDYVTPTQAIVSLTNIQNLHVEYAVSEKYLAQLKIGQNVDITTNAYPDKKFTGKVAFISPIVNATDRTIAVYALIPNADRKLTAGLYVSVSQSLGSQQNALIIPSTSLVPTIDGQVIYKISANKAYAVPVRILQRTINTVAVAGAIKLNDKIAITNQDKLKDGMPVHVIEN